MPIKTQRWEVGGLKQACTAHLGRLHQIALRVRQCAPQTKSLSILQNCEVRQVPVERDKFLRVATWDDAIIESVFPLSW